MSKESGTYLVEEKQSHCLDDSKLSKHAAAVCYHGSISSSVGQQNKAVERGVGDTGRRCSRRISDGHFTNKKRLLPATEALRVIPPNGKDELNTQREAGLNDTTSPTGERADVRPKSAGKGGLTPVTSIIFHQLSYEVKQRTWLKTLPNKTILNSVRLLDLLADRKDKVGRSGMVLINGRKRQTNYKTTVGYVVQDDILMGTLSVRENLEFSAALRLPGHMTQSQRRERVGRVIETLGLLRSADTKVGTEFFRGVSGGERKRTNIGMELITEPQVLFLDEPTTGVDAHTAVSIISLLKELTMSGEKMIILSIHQPRYSIFKLFDSLTLLSQGSVVYHGMAHNALSYFNRLGFMCGEHENPVDVFLDTIMHYERYLHQDSEKTTTASDEEAARDRVNVISNSLSLREIYLRSDEYSSLRARIEPILVEEKRRKSVNRYSFQNKVARELYSTSFLWQLLILMKRSTRNLLKSPQPAVFQLSFCVLGVLIGTLFWQLDTQPNNFMDRIGAFFTTTGQSFASLGTVQLFIQQRALFIHESASGYYRVSAFFLSKVATDLIPFHFLPNLCFTITMYFMIGFQVKVEKFIIFWLILTMVNICAVSIAFFISVAVRNGAVANIMIITPFIFSMLFAGFLITADSLPVWVAWLRYFSFMKYGIEAFAINEMSGLHFQGPWSDCAFDGLSQLHQLGYSNTSWAMWWDIFALLVFSVFFLSLAYMTLRSMKKEK